MNKIFEFFGVLLGGAIAGGGYAFYFSESFLLGAYTGSLMTGLGHTCLSTLKLIIKK